MKDKYRFSRLMHIIEAALEYFISIAVGTVYLAKITTYMGISDALTGILSAFVSLGCGFQMVAIFLSYKKPVKGWVTLWHIVSQILFSCVYFVPLLDIGKAEKAALFVAVLLISQVIHNIINSPKINWFMSLVEDGKRGRFTANKEIVSLLGGVVFSYALGAVMDHYEARGDMRTAFAICGVGLVCLMLLHTVTLVLSKEKPDEAGPIPVKDSLRALVKNKTLFKIALVSVFWNIANYATVSFTGTYQAKELAFSATFSSVIIMAGSLVRAVFSRPMGRFADRTSFCRMLTVCFAIEAVAFGINIFTVPSNGRVFYFAYYILHSIGMAGINSSVINLIYDYVDHSQRTGALAVQQTLAGFSGFFAVLFISPLVEWIQDSKITAFGAPVYAQQIMSAISCVFVILIMIYINRVIKKLRKV